MLSSPQHEKPPPITAMYVLPSLSAGIALNWNDCAVAVCAREYDSFEKSFCCADIFFIFPDKTQSALVGDLLGCDSAQRPTL